MGYIVRGQLFNSDISTSITERAFKRRDGCPTKRKALDLFEDTDIAVSGAVRTCQDAGLWLLPAVLSLPALLGHSGSAAPGGAARGAGSCLRWERQPRLLRSPAASSSCGHTELQIVLSRNPAAQLRTQGHPSSVLQLAREQGEQGGQDSSSETQSSSHITSEALLLTIPILCTFQRSISSCQAPLGLPLSRKTHQPWTQKVFWYFPLYLISIPVTYSTEDFSHHKHLSPHSGRTGTLTYTHSLKTGRGSHSMRNSQHPKLISSIVHLK